MIRTISKLALALSFMIPAGALAVSPDDRLERFLSNDYESIDELKSSFLALDKQTVKRLEDVAEGKIARERKDRKLAIRALAFNPTLEHEKLLVRIIEAEPTDDFVPWHMAMFTLSYNCHDNGRGALRKLLNEVGSDWKKKVFALQTISSCGTAEDIPLAESLENHPNAEVKEKAKKAKKVLEERFPAP